MDEWAASPETCCDVGPCPTTVASNREGQPPTAARCVPLRAKQCARTMRIDCEFASRMCESGIYTYITHNCLYMSKSSYIQSPQNQRDTICLRDWSFQKPKNTLQKPSPVIYVQQPSSLCCVELHLATTCSSFSVNNSATLCTYELAGEACHSDPCGHTLRLRSEIQHTFVVHETGVACQVAPAHHIPFTPSPPRIP